MRTLVIRADASAAMGTGHIMRCLALAQAWQDARAAVILVTAALAPALAERLHAEGIELVALKGEPGTFSDAEFTAQTAKARGADWVVLDGYQFNSAYRQRLKPGIPHLLSIDDNNELSHFFSDIVLNQNLHATQALYLEIEPGTRLLLGTRFALLRREFRAWQGWQRTIPEVARHVLVTLGGADPNNVTLKVLNALAQVQTPALETVIVVGANNPHAAAIRDAAAQSHVLMRVETNVSDMARLMAWADMAIAGAGSTCWELAMLGVPSIVLELADNQAGTAREMAARGIFPVVRDLHFAPAQLSEMIAKLARDRALRETMGQRAQVLVDGNGAVRTVAAMNPPMLNLRRVRAEDCLLLWEWANDLETRANSFSTDPIPLEAHVAWFERILVDPTTFFYIAVNARGTPVGQIRFIVEDKRAVVSTSIAPTERGCGYGTLLIARGADALFAATDAERLDAYIKPENEISRRAFVKAGFVDVGETTYQGNRSLLMQRGRNDSAI